MVVYKPEEVDGVSMKDNTLSSAVYHIGVLLVMWKGKKLQRPKLWYLLGQSETYQGMTWLQSSQTVLQGNPRIATPSVPHVLDF